MAVQRYQAAFRTATWGNVIDGGNATVPGLTAGGTLIDTVSLIPPFLQRWTLINVSIQALLVRWAYHNIIINPTWGHSPYGRYDSILAGLVVPGSPTDGALWQFANLPADQSSIVTLWDPGVDPLPPYWNGDSGLETPSPALSISAGITPASPIDINQGEAIGIGLWIKPALLGSADGNPPPPLAVCGALYALIYDDGLPG